MSARSGLLIGTLTVAGSVLLYVYGRRTAVSTLNGQYEFPYEHRRPYFTRECNNVKAAAWLKAVDAAVAKHRVQTEEQVAQKWLHQHAKSEPRAEAWQRKRDDVEYGYESVRRDHWLPLPNLEEQEVDMYEYDDLEDEAELPFGAHR